MKSTPTREILSSLEKAIKKEFDLNQRILTFDEFTQVVAQNPNRILRGSAKYTVDMMDFFGKTALKDSDDTKIFSDLQTTYHFNLFDLPVENHIPKVVGHEDVQTRIYRVLQSFVRTGVNNKLILLHGPNGSAKSSLIHSLMNGAEKYSHESEGALYTFNWVFPVEKLIRGGLGLSSTSSVRDPMASYAHLEDEDIAAKVPCEYRDHPILIVPSAHRLEFLKSLVGDKKAEELWNELPQNLKQGELCRRCNQISEALLSSHLGDFRKLLLHIQVERFFLSRKFRHGLVTVEPQMHVDAQYHQLTLNKNWSFLPSSLQALNLFSMSGDLVDSSRGILEYSDLLKRPIDSFKYLLIACETGTVNVGPTIAQLDAVMLGSTNEVQLDAFKEFPDFTSFKARIELIRVPYLVQVRKEKQIYNDLLPRIAGEKHVSPHVAWSVAMWAVLTRLKKPNSVNFNASVSQMISRLTPIEKIMLYDRAEAPTHLSNEEKKLIRTNVHKIYDEYSGVPYYEGRVGASAREVKSILFDASEDPEFRCLSPLAVMKAIETFVKRTSEHEFLRQEVKEGYHDAHEFIQTIRNEYLNCVDSEVREAIGLYDRAQWEDFMRKYVQHVALVLKNEKTKNPITGEVEDPDRTLISEFEAIVGVNDSMDRTAFRQSIITQVGAWSLDHKNEAVVYAKVFPEFWAKLEKHYFESQKNLLTKMHDALLFYSDDTSAFKGDGMLPKSTTADSEGSQLATKTVGNLCKSFGYCPRCAKEVITFLLKVRY